MGKRGPKPVQTIATEWTPELARAVGLLASDGSLSKDGRHVDFTSKDKVLVQTFKQCIKCAAPVTEKRSGAGAASYRIQVSSVLFYQWLERIGFMSNKSKTLGAIDIPDVYFFDFLRGCFDGDGSTYSFWDKRWKSSFVFCLYIVSASPTFLRWTKQTVERLSGVKGAQYKGKTVSYLQFGKESTRALAHQMYCNDTAPRLERKFTKLQETFRIDEQNNRTNARVAKPVNASA